MSGLKRPATATAIFAMLCGNAAIMYVDRTNMSIAAPVMQRELGLNNVSIGVIFAAFSIAYTIFMVVGGRIGDLIGSRRGLTLCGILWAIGTLATGLVGGFIWLIVARFIVGMGEAAVYPISSYVIARWISRERRGAAQGILHGCGRLGAAATPFAVTGLIVAFSWRSAFIVLGVISVIFTGVIWIFLRDDPRQHPRVTPDELARLGYEPEAPPGAPAVSKLEWGEFVHRVWPVTTVSFSYGFLSWFLLSWVPLYFAHVHGLNLKRVAIFSTLVLIGGVLGMVLGGVATDWWLTRTGSARRARRDILVLSFVTSMLCIVPLLLTANLAIDTAALALAYFLIEFADPSIWMLGMEVLPSHAATSTATVNTGFALAGFVSPLLVGWILDATAGNWNDVFIASIALLVVGIAAAFRVRLADEAPAAQAPMAAN